MFAVNFGYSLTFNHFNDWFYIMGIKSRLALMTAIYKKSTRMDNESRMSRTVGPIVNLMSLLLPLFPLLLCQPFLAGPGSQSFQVAHLFLPKFVRLQGALSLGSDWRLCDRDHLNPAEGFTLCFQLKAVSERERSSRLEQYQ